MHIIAFIFSLALFIGGLFIMGNAFYASGFEGLVFTAGILTTALGLFVPVHILKRIDN